MKSAQGRGSEKSSPSKSQANGRRQNIRISAKKALFLPLFAEVVELTDRGFGFAASVSGQRLFFHRNAGIRRDDFEILKPGVPILALVGSDPRRGDRKEIVRWAALDHIVWDDGAPNEQASWDKMRRVGLGEFLERLDAVLRPNWYVQKWGDKSAPADLEDDLLRGLELGRIGCMDQGELNRFDPLTLSESVLYNFAQCFDTAHPDAVSLLDHVPAERLLLFGQPGPQVLSRASEARRVEVIAWFVRVGGAEATGRERDEMLSGRASWEAEAASRLLDSGLLHGAGLVRWLEALRTNGLLPEGFVEAIARADGEQVLLYLELLSEKQKESLLSAAAATHETRTAAIVLRPDIAPDLAWRVALAFDLETDGNTTRQIGTATAAGSSLLFDGGGPGEQAEAFAKLTRRLSKAPIVVGHNVLIWNREEDREARLSDVADLLRCWLRPDDVDRLVGRGASRVLSTIHKVRGLEFDDVIIMPSTCAFPMGHDDPARAAAEEARVLYVAGTRAKARMLRLHGEREAAWHSDPPRTLAGQDESRFLNGSGAEIDLGWTADGRGFNSNPAGLHENIERHVAVGDPISVGGRGGGAGRALFHINLSGLSTQVGFLAFRTGSAGPEADLRVAAVVRFFPDTPPRWANGRAWAYAVLVEGRLR